MIMEGKRQKIYVYRSRSILCLMSFPGGSDGKESSWNTEDVGSIPGLGGSLGEGNGNPLQYSCLGNPMDRGADGLWSTVSQRVRHAWVTNTYLLTSV